VAPEKKQISVFIASPGDLSPERERFRETIEKLNSGFGDGFGTNFIPLGWEDTLASSGRRSQSVINSNIDRCDIFILALNRRWGQEAPDSSYSSYTEEEFYRAFERFKAKGEPEIFVFFKRVGPESEADPGPQLQKVMEFRQSLEDSRQFIYRTFTDLDSFEKEVDLHLRSFAKGELPVSVQTGLTPLPFDATEEINRTKLALETANEKASSEAAVASDLAQQIAVDAAEAALEGKVEKARQRFSKAIQSTTNGRVLSLAFEFYFRTGDFDSADDVAKRWRASTELNSDHRGRADTALGMLHQTRGELDKALPLYQKALAAFQHSGNEELAASAYGNIGRIHQTQGRSDKAVTFFTKALTIYENLTQEEGMATTYLNLGIANSVRGEFDMAVDAYRMALELNKRLGREVGMAHTHMNWGVLYLNRKSLDKAQSMFQNALAICEKLGIKEGMANAYGNLGIVHQEQSKSSREKNKLGEAVVMYQKALDIHEELGNKEGIARTLGNLATVRQIGGDIAKAISINRQALATYKEIGSKVGIAATCRNLGNLYLELGDPKTSFMMYQEAIANYEEAGSKEGIADVHISLGILYAAQTDPENARENLIKSICLFEELGSPRAAEVQALLSRLDNE